MLIMKYIYCLTPVVLAQMVACLPLVQRLWGSIPNEVVNFHLKIFNLGLGCTSQAWIKFQTLLQYIY